MKAINIIVITLLFNLYATAQELVDSSTPSDVLPQNGQLGNKWVLDFSDEFNSNELDLSKWSINVSSKSRNARPKIGIKDWYWKSHNVWLENDNLVLQVEKHDHNTMYCGSVNSKSKYETLHGYFEVKVKIADASKGTHTAFWFQGGQMSNVDGTGNDGAEIDIFESAWLEDYTKSVIHIDGYGANHQANTKKYNTPGLHEGYHIFGFHWTEDFMKIYYDGKLKVTYTGDKWMVKVPEYIWLSDGASFGIEGDYFTREADGVLTQAYVDYVRVWKSVVDTSATTNTIKNGDFESNTDWSKSSSDIIIGESVYPVDGSKYVRFPGIPNSRSITQTVNVDANETYTFAFSGRVQNSHAANAENYHSTKGAATLSAQLLNGTEVIAELSTQSNTNTTLSKEVVIPSGVSEVSVKVSKNWNVAYADNIELTKNVQSEISNTKHQTLSIYPNPQYKGGTLHVKSQHPVTKYMIYTMSGQLIYQVIGINRQSFNIDTEKLITGSYILSTFNTLGKHEANKIMIK